VARAQGVAGTRWQPEALPLGTLYWRVTAASRSGLDGFPSAPTSIVVETLWRRPTPF